MENSESLKLHFWKRACTSLIERHVTYAESRWSLTGANASKIEEYLWKLVVVGEGPEVSLSRRGCSYWLSTRLDCSLSYEAMQRVPLPLAGGFDFYRPVKTRELSRATRPWRLQ